jgi:tRNA (cytidine/uridine-2'-O-)-methyltransferase
MRLALFEPDIPQNTGTLMRLCACLDVAMDIIEPCGFLLSDRTLKRAGMDYMEHLDLTRHLNWASFKAAAAGKRLIVMSTKTDRSFLDFKFEPEDILIAGRESAGIPDMVRAECTDLVTIPMAQNVRSLNVAVASALVLGEALRQTHQYPKGATA